MRTAHDNSVSRKFHDIIDGKEKLVCCHTVQLQLQSSKYNGFTQRRYQIGVVRIIGYIHGVMHFTEIHPVREYGKLLINTSQEKYSPRMMYSFMSNY